MAETVVALLADDKVAYGTVGAAEDGQEWIIWEQGAILPAYPFTIVPVEAYDAHRLAA